MSNKSNEIKLSPLRSLDDFLLGSARFQLPNFKDLDKWGNRVVQNLLYYQTNYFLMGVIMILTVTVLHPAQMACGGITILIMYGLFWYLVNSNRSMEKFKKNHPVLGIVIMIGGASFVVYMLGSLIVFLFGILLPISATFIHASLRLRNIMNKLSNIERVVSNRTPMGVFLESLAQHTPAIPSSEGLCSYVVFFLLFFILKGWKLNHEHRYNNQRRHFSVKSAEMFGGDNGFE